MTLAGTESAATSASTLKPASRPPVPETIPEGTPTIQLRDGSRVPGDPSWFTWSRLFRCAANGCTNKEVLQYQHMRSIYNGASMCRKCEKERDWLLKYSPVVTFMKQKLEELGVPEVTRKNFQCRICDVLKFDSEGRHLAAGGGFIEGSPILVCANTYDLSRRRLEDIMTHEMVHAYDYARFKVDPLNIKHQACTEIRANLLSGECRFLREFFNGPTGGINLKFKMHFQDCVRRRAIGALRGRKGIDDLAATRAVNSVWENCFRDTRPFDEVYR